MDASLQLAERERAWEGGEPATLAKREGAWCGGGMWMGLEGGAGGGGVEWWEPKGEPRRAGVGGSERWCSW